MKAALFRLSAIAVGATLAILTLAIVDRVIIVRWAPPFRYLMPPGSRISYTTCEFHCVTSINSLGMRDREVDLAKKERCFRILALGDSFTHGWGVEAEQSWPKVLEQQLQQSGCNVEVVNAGAAGIGTEAYADIAEEFIPAMKPDLVIVAVLQGDDLAQAIPPGGSTSAIPTWRRYRRCLRVVAETVCPHLCRYRRYRAGAPMVLEMTDAWRATVAQRIAKMSSDEQDWFEQLDPTVRELFQSGNLNPALVTQARVEPDHYSMTLHLDREKVQARLQKVTRHFERIRTAADRHGARLMICTVPYGAFVDRDDWENARRVGFEVEEAFLTSTAPDDAIGLACDAAGAKFVSVFAAMRREGNRRRLYYPWDGHFNEEGHRLFAELLAPHVR